MKLKALRVLARILVILKSFLKSESFSKIELNCDRGSSIPITKSFHKRTPPFSNIQRSTTFIHIMSNDRVSVAFRSDLISYDGQIQPIRLQNNLSIFDVNISLWSDPLRIVFGVLNQGPEAKHLSKAECPSQKQASPPLRKHPPTNPMLEPNLCKKSGTCVPLESDVL